MILWLAVLAYGLFQLGNAGFALLHVGRVDDFREPHFVVRFALILRSALM